MTIFGIPFHAQTDERNEIGEAVQRNLRILQSHSRNPLKMYLARWWPGKDAIKTRCVCVCVCVHARARARVRVRGGHVCLSCVCVCACVRFPCTHLFPNILQSGGGKRSVACD